MSLKNIVLQNNILGTRLSNQRTYCSFMSTGLGLATIAYALKRYTFSLLGILMIIASTIEYYRIEYNLNHNYYSAKSLLYLCPIVVTITIIITFSFLTYELKTTYGANL
jgi:uncharacterized membrane protein YidH (DUF202 family)